MTIRPLIAALCAVAALAAGGPVAPARYRAGALPAMPAQAASGGEVFLELTISPSGGVTGVAPLRTTPPFTQLLIGAVRTWQFLPAEESIDATVRRRVTAKV